MGRLHENPAVRTTFPVLVVVGDRGIGHGKQGVPGKIRILRVIIAVQHLSQDFQPALDVITHPLALQFRSRIVPSEIIHIGQPQKIYRFDERATGVMKIGPCAIFDQWERLDIHVEPGGQQVVITGGHQGPIDQPGILVPEGIAPGAIIGIVVAFGGACAPRKIMADGEERAVELDRLRAAPRARRHVTLDGVTLGNRFASGRGADLNPAPVPKFHPPLLMSFPCRADFDGIG